MVLEDGDVVLRPLRLRDAAAWWELRAANVSWLAPWEATSPDGVPPVRSFPSLVRDLNRQGRSGQALPFALEHDGRLAGQVTVGGITWGAMRSAHVGYWLDGRLAGRGIMPRAVAMAVDHCFFAVGLHRIEVNIRPENRPSLRVVEKLGLRPEGERLRYLHIDGAWRDHLAFAVTSEEVPQGLVARWRSSRGA
ncbi:ribosomal-protein-alanine N-acetyltransferase [Quadrisphaera sp. DSM 44207]|nr:ribosomal-protein-alanine N-acetyltransferase [Quadrisphaera sp. DSM 44207]